LDYLPDRHNFPWKATLIWLVCVSVTRSTFSVTLGRGMLRRRVLVLGNGAKAARIAGLVEAADNEHFLPISYLGVSGERPSVRANAIDWTNAEPDALAETCQSAGASEIVSRLMTVVACRYGSFFIASSPASK